VKERIKVSRYPELCDVLKEVVLIWFWGALGQRFWGDVELTFLPPLSSSPLLFSTHPETHD
jgi:hypothetical protein